MSLEKLIESYYAPKKGNELLIQLIENKINEVFIPATTRINLPSGKGEREKVSKKGEVEKLPPTKEYEDLKKLFLGIVNRGNTLSERLNVVSQFLNIDKSQVAQMPVDQAFSSMLLIQELKESLEKLNPSAAGFQMETIISQILQGSILDNNSIVDVQKSSGDFLSDYSLKTLSYDNLKIGGSFYNFCEKFAEIEKKRGEVEQYEYVIITKDTSKGIYKFYEWKVDYNEFYKIIVKPTGFLDTGIKNGVFVIDTSKISIEDFKVLAQKGVQEKGGLRRTYKLSKKIYERTDNKGNIVYFITVPPLGSEEDANDMFSNLQTKQATKAFTPATAMMQRFSDLRFIDLQKDLFTNAQNFKLETQFNITQNVINKNIKEGGALKATFDLSDNNLKVVESKYQDTLVGKMTQILRDNEIVLRSMNEYFATHEKQKAEQALSGMTAVKDGFKEFSKQVSPDIAEI